MPTGPLTSTFKVVGTGSAGTRDYVALPLDRGRDAPRFLDKGRQDALLDVEMPVTNGRQRCLKNGEVFHRLLDAVVGDAIGGGPVRRHT
jgi:hypothetical protein